jgi:hypothetical protein
MLGLMIKSPRRRLIAALVFAVLLAGGVIALLSQ